jgi:hypothetical protein
VAQKLNLPLTPVLPVHLCPVTGPLYAALMGYKESRIEEVRRRSSRRVRDLFALFFASHRACLMAAVGGAIDIVVPVPSSSRPGRASLEGVDGLAEVVISSLGGQARWIPSTLRRAEGPIGHMQPDARAFAVPGGWRIAVANARILLLDDTYVSGARAQSAAAALRLAGARSVLVVPPRPRPSPGTVPRPRRIHGRASW